MSEESKTAGPYYNPSEYIEEVNVNSLGVYLDGWADLVEGMGEKVSEVREKVNIGLNQKDMPGIRSAKKNATVSVYGGEKRDYLVTKTEPGATTAIYIDKFGVDLYVSWRTYINSVVNKNVVFTILGISTFLGLIIGGIQESVNFAGRSQTSFSFFGWIGSTIAFALVAFLITAFAGRFVKGNFLAFFFIEPNVFDADDITAMSLAVHKTILRSLDSAGIDVTKLRLKQNFKGGRRDEML